MNNNRILSPSMLSANFASIKDDVNMINQSCAQWIHLDVMDGVFVPNITFGLPLLKAVRSLTEKTLDVHLMIVEPHRYIKQFAEAGADYLTVHYETSIHLNRTLQTIKECGMKAGVALNPHTPLSSVEEILDMADMILIMSVNPGFAAQKFIDSSLDKVIRLREMIDKKGYSTLIQVDGGISENNSEQLYNAGANVLVAGNAVFSSSNPPLTIEKIIKGV